MTRSISVVLLSMLLALSAFANGPVQPASILTSSGTVDPIISPWGLDLVNWTTVGTAPTIFGRSGGGIIGNYMYSFGSEAVNCAQAFNLTTELWVASTLAPVGIDNWASATTADAVYLIGGYNGITALNNMQQFTPTGGGPTGTWTQKRAYPQTVYGPTAAWDGGDFIYTAGGNTMTGFSLTAYKYSISTDNWTAIAIPPVSQSFSGSAFIGGKFYVFGGTDAAGLGTRHYVYDPSTNAWTMKAPVPTAVWFATYSTTFDAANMYSVGGGGGYASWPATNAVQIYNAATNIWTQETVLPVARGCNLARWAGNGKVISGGGYATTYSGVTYRGLGFGGGAPANVTIAMSPVSGPVVIPAAGGSFDYNISATNHETTSQTCQVWVMVTLPTGSSYGPVLGPVTVTLSAGATLARVRTQSVPAVAPSGAYIYTGHVGIYPGASWNEASFPFTKSATGDGFQVGGWACTGESFEQEATFASSTPQGFALKGAFPNPFNPETNLTFTMPEAGNVELAVYDIQGREVARLMDGYQSQGEHSVTFNASHLSSGVYFAVLNANGQQFTQKMLLVK